MPRKKLKRTQSDVAFDLYESLKYALRDLEKIDRLIPSESSRSAYGLLGKDVEAVCIIEARKTELLGYIQIICRDHLHFGRKLLAKGWEPEHAKQKWNEKDILR